MHGNKLGHEKDNCLSGVVWVQYVLRQRYILWNGIYHGDPVMSNVDFLQVLLLSPFRPSEKLHKV